MIKTSFVSIFVLCKVYFYWKRCSLYIVSPLFTRSSLRVNATIAIVDSDEAHTQLTQVIHRLTEGQENVTVFGQQYSVHNMYLDHSASK